jgi:hypothetical protein
MMPPTRRSSGENFRILVPALKAALAKVPPIVVNALVFINIILLSKN